jgi:5-methylcytosine-specific restriction endonuclease McrA
MRDLTQSELIEFYTARRPEDKLDFALRMKLVSVIDDKFVRQNSVPRTVDEMPTANRASIHYRDKECAYCGDTEDLTVDHLIPFSAWDEQHLWLANTSSNLVSACWDCNHTKSANLYKDPPFKQLWPIVGRCTQCKPSVGQCGCEPITAWCNNCRHPNATVVCSLPNINCEANKW